VRRTAVAATAVAGLALAACSSGNAADGPATSPGDPAKCPAEQVTVVVSVSQWSDLAQTLGGDCAAVTTVLRSGSTDPHDFEPRPSDIAAFTDADVVLVNGAGYDAWASDAVDTLDTRPAVLTVADIAGAPEGNPHLWYDPDVVDMVATSLTAELAQRSPDAADYFAERARASTADLAPYLAAVAAVRDAAGGRSYAATEPVFDDMAAAVGLADRTPRGYRQAVSNDSDPSPGEIAAFDSELADGGVDVLVVNRQTEGSLTDQLRAAAEDAGVPVVEVTESPPEDAGSFVAWQVAQLEDLETALAGSP